MREPLEDFFKKKLTSDREEGWNVPSDDIWEKALPHFVEEKRKRKFAFWWWLVASFLLVLGGGLYLYSDSEKNGEHLMVNNDEISKTTQQIDKNTKIELNNTDAQLKVEHIEKIEKKVPVHSITKIRQGSKGKYYTKKGFDRKILSDKNSPKVVNYPEHGVPDIVLHEWSRKKDESLFESRINQDKAVVSQDVDLVSNLPILVGSVDGEPYSLPIFFNKSQRILNAHSKRLLVSLSYTPSMSRLDVIPQDMHISGNKKFQFSNNVEIGITKFLTTNWAVKTGVGIINIASKTESEQVLFYDESTEYTMPNNKIVNPISFRTNSPLGEFEMSTMLTLPASNTVASGDLMHSYISHNQLVRYLYVPLGLQFQKPISKGFSVQSNIGVAYNYLLRDDVKTTGRMMHDADEMELEVMKFKRMNPLSKSIFSASVGLGLAKKITSRISVFTNLSYTHSLTPVVESNQQKTQFSSLQVGIGVGYNF